MSETASAVRRTLEEDLESDLDATGQLQQAIAAVDEFKSYIETGVAESLRRAILAQKSDAVVEIIAEKNRAVSTIQGYIQSRSAIDTLFLDPDRHGPS